jgi:outer membrane protein TolC
VVKIALLQNRTLQAAFNELGITEAQLVQSTLPANPLLSLGQLGNHAVLEIERTLLVNLLSLLTLPQRKEIAEVKLKIAQLRAIDEVLKTASEARRAYVSAATSKQLVRFLEETYLSAKTTSKLFMRLGETGAVNKLDQAREHVYTAEIAGKLAQARLMYQVDLEKLTRAMGLAAPYAFALAPLDALPMTTPNLLHIEQEAVSRRVDLTLARLDVETAAKQAGLTQATRYMNVLELRGRDNLDRSFMTDSTTGLVTTDKTRRAGVEVELMVPLFDWGQARSQEAKEGYLRAVNRLYAKAVMVRSEAREAHARFKAAHQIALHYKSQILPLRKIIQDAQMLRYNAMLIDIMPILAENRQRINAHSEAINALKAYHLAKAELKTAVIGGGVVNAALATSPSGEQAQGGH